MKKGDGSEAPCVAVLRNQSLYPSATARSLQYAVRMSFGILMRNDMIICRYSVQRSLAFLCVSLLGRSKVYQPKYKKQAPIHLYATSPKGSLTSLSPPQSASSRCGPGPVSRRGCP